MAKQNAGTFNAEGNVNIGINLDTTALTNLTKTLKDVSKGKDLQNYWGDVESAIENTNRALKRFSSNMDSSDYAKNLIKSANALKALSGKTDLSDIFGNVDFENILESAKKVAPQIASEFSVSNFSDAFKTFDLLKDKGIELLDVFKKLSDYTKLSDDLFSARIENRDFKKALGDNNVDTLREQIKEINNLRSEAKETFNSFLNLNNIKGNDDYDYRFDDYFDRIENGSLTAKQAIIEFKREYGYLLEESNPKDNGLFGIEQLEQFSSKLSSIFSTVEDMSKKINDIFENGVVSKTIQDFGIVDESSMQNVEKATTSAAEAKENFVSANENVQGSVDGSKSKLELEAELMEKIAQSAKEAADAKEKFVAANEKVANSANETVYNTKSKQSQNTAVKKNTEEYKKHLAIIQQLTDARTALNNAERLDKNGNRSIEIADIKKQISDLQPKANAAAQAIEKMYNPQNGGQATITAEQYNAALEKINESAKGSAKSVNDLIAAQKRNLENINKDYESDVSTWKEKLANRETKPAEGKRSSTYEANLEAMRTAVGEMETLQQRMKSTMEQGIAPSEDDVKAFEDLKTKVQGCEQAFKNMSTAEKGASEMSRDKLFNKIDDYLQKNSRMAKEFKVQLQALQKELSMRGADANVADLTDQFLKLQIQIREAGQEGRSFFDVLKDKAWYGVIGQIATYFSFNDIIRYGGEAAKTVRELDTALTEMRKVSDESTQSLKEYQKETFDVADAAGTTAKQIQNSTADYMRLGESLSEAAESARVANVLLNVSEFNSIEDATKSLVSMGQAYKDLDKMTIVDKLNEIGNNYSISTDELASSLQRSAATLSLMGNTIDEAAALVTTANATIQDADSVSAGLRTISLRLIGTEEAEEQLSALNEEIDAFVVATNSKKQQIIKDYTAVASNNYKGFDILDDNGNYKNTYEILLGIAKVYKEIQEQDKKLGTNHAVALIEELAGELLPEKYGNIFYSTYLTARKALIGQSYLLFIRKSLTPQYRGNYCMTV